MKNLLKKSGAYLGTNNRLVVFTLAFLLVFSLGSYALAAALYHPSDNELDPTCAPGDPDCYVDILPDQTGNAGKYLSTDGTVASWSTFGGFTLPSLTAGSVLFSDGTTIAQDNANFSYDSAAHKLTLGGPVASPGTFNIRTTTSGNAIVLKTTFTDVTSDVTNALKFVDGWGTDWEFHQQPNNTGSFYLSRSSQRIMSFNAVTGVEILQPGGGTLDPVSILYLANTAYAGSGSKGLNINVAGGLPESGTFTGISLDSNITYTGGVGTTLLIDLKKLGVSKFKVNDSGDLTTTGGVTFAGLPTSVGTDYVCFESVTKVVTYGVSCGVSSERFKHDIATLGGNLDKVMRLRPVSYDLNTNNAHNIGFIAEEVSLIEPRVVVYEADGITPHSLNYAQFAPLLAGAIQELNLKIEALQASSGHGGGSVASSIASYLADTVLSIKEATIATLRIGDKVCVDDVCVTKEQFKNLLIQAGGTAPTPPPVVEDPADTPPGDESGGTPPSDETVTPPSDETPPSDTPEAPVPEE